MTADIAIADQPQLANRGRRDVIALPLNKRPDSLWLSFFRPNVGAGVELEDQMLYALIERGETPDVVGTLEAIEAAISDANARVRELAEQEEQAALRRERLQSDLERWWEERSGSHA